MKKYLLFVAIIGFSVATLCSCGDKSVKLVSQNALKNSAGNGETGVFKNYKEAVRANDYDAAHIFLDEIYNDFENTWKYNYDGMHYNNNNRSSIEIAATKYSSAASYILCAEARYLISNDPDGAKERINYLFNERVILGEPVQGLGYHPGGGKSYQEACAKLDCYKQTVKYNNELCDVVLNLAIANHNEELAKVALSYYMQNWVLTDDVIGDNVVWQDNDKKSAQQKYNEEFGKKEEKGSEYAEESAPAQPTPKKSVNSKRRRR